MMQGQWIGDFTSEDPPAERGLVIVNLDGTKDRIDGTCYVFEESAGHFGTVFALSGNSNDGTFKASGRAVGIADPRSNTILPLEAATQAAPDRAFPHHVELQGRFTARCQATVVYQTDIPTRGNATLHRADAQRPSDLVPKTVTWPQFKELVTHGHGNMLFRGQRHSWRLRTAFHRSGRADIRKFSQDDVMELRRALTGILSFKFQLEDAEAHTALLGLAQHHGYPTPLLDWTRSPYVAAYFACREFKSKTNEQPRVYALDEFQLRRISQPVPAVDSPMLTMWPIEPLPLFNSRLIPQQSVVTFCNVDDVEGWLTQRGKAIGANMLVAYDLLEDPKTILRELRLMGIHAGSLFPGIDGVCQSLAEKNFMAVE